MRETVECGTSAHLVKFFAFDLLHFVLVCGWERERERHAQGPQPVDHYVKCHWAALAATVEA